MEKIKNALILFLNFFKIGLFTFGGGYAMVAIIEKELVEKRKWLSHDEFLDVVAIAESTPGPIAINSATYIGFKRAKFLGSLFATLGVVLPSFIIIFVISLFYKQFLALEYVSYAFMGIRAGVAFLILSAGFKLFKKQKKSLFNLILFFLTVVLLLLTEFFGLNVSSILFILAGGLVGIIVYLLTDFKNKKKKDIEGGKE